MLAEPSFWQGGDSPTGLIIQLLKLDTMTAGLTTAMVKAVSAAREPEPQDNTLDPNTAKVRLSLSLLAFSWPKRALASAFQASYLSEIKVGIGQFPST